MENLCIVSSSKLAMGVPQDPTHSTVLSSMSFVGLPNLLSKSTETVRRFNQASSFRFLSSFPSPRANRRTVQLKAARNSFSCISSSGQQTTTVGVPSIPPPPPASHVGSPLFWIGVGVAGSALFSWVAGRAKKYAMEQAFKTFTQQMNTQNSQSGSIFPPSSPYPFPAATYPASGSFRASSPVTSQLVTEVVPEKVEDPPSISVEEKKESDTVTKKYAFVDVSPEETLQKNAFESYKESAQVDPQDKFSPTFSQNGATIKRETVTSNDTSTGMANPLLSVEALEKMMEDPTVQKMVYPYLPEEMRNPTTFKWMLQNPQYRQQLQEMLNNTGGNPEWDSRMMDSLKNFDLSSPEIKQQFDQIGFTPEEVISRIMGNPDVAMAFQNPRVQAAIMDCSQNPLSIAKYQNDKEVMDVFNKISELFPGVN